MSTLIRHRICVIMYLVMDFDESHFLKKKQKHLTEWVSRFKKAKDILPEVQKNLDMTNWGIEALTNLPIEVLPEKTEKALERDCNAAMQAYPMIPIIAASTTATSMATAGTSGLYDYVAKCEDSDIPCLSGKAA